MEQKDLILDFNLYLCEKFGYRNSCSVMQNANGLTGASSSCAATLRRTKPKAWKTWLVSSRSTCHATATDTSVPKVMTTSIIRRSVWSSSIKTCSDKKTMDWRWKIWMSDTYSKVKEGIFPLLNYFRYAPLSERTVWNTRQLGVDNTQRNKQLWRLL